jgi:hypothetical protein
MGKGKGGRGRGEGRGGEGTNAFARTQLVSARTQGCVYTDASVLSPDNFIMDTRVRLSYGRPSSHHPIVRPSVIVRVTTLLVNVSVEETSLSKIRLQRRLLFMSIPRICLEGEIVIRGLRSLQELWLTMPWR